MPATAATSPSGSRPAPGARAARPARRRRRRRRACGSGGELERASRASRRALAAELVGERGEHVVDARGELPASRGSRSMTSSSMPSVHGDSAADRAQSDQRLMPPPRSRSGRAERGRRCLDEARGRARGAAGSSASVSACHCTPQEGRRPRRIASMRLDDAVRRPGDGAQARADGARRPGGGRSSPRSSRRRGSRPRREPGAISTACVAGGRATVWRWSIVPSVTSGRCWIQRAAAGDVERLRPAADAEDGHAAARPPRAPRASSKRSRSGSVGPELGVRRARRSSPGRGPGPPDRQTPRSRSSSGPIASRLQRRQHDGQAAGALDRPQVGEAERHLALRRVALRQRRAFGGRRRTSEVVTPMSGRGASRAATQVSFAPPFCDELTTSAPSSNATRVSPPGEHVRRAARVRKMNGRRSTWRGASRAVDGGGMAWTACTSSWAIEGLGLAGDRAARAPRRPPRRRVRADDHADAAVARARLDDELVETVERLAREVLGRARSKVAHGRTAAAPRRGRSAPCPRRRRGRACRRRRRCRSALTTPERSRASQRLEQQLADVGRRGVSASVRR